MKHLTILACLLSAAPLIAGDEIAASDENKPFAPEPGLNFLSALNAAQIEFGVNLGMDFDNSAAGLDAYSAEFFTFLGRPLSLPGGFDMLTAFQYESMLLRPDTSIPNFPLGDEDLHELELHFALYRYTKENPWVYGAWINPSLSTDFQSISGDDFFLNVAGGVGYQFSDAFTLGIGVGGFNLTGDSRIYPGIAFVWNPCPEIFVTLFGPNFIAAREMSDSWRVGFEVRPVGGIWNYSADLGQSQNIDFRSYRAGLYSNHRLTEKLWLGVGVGITTGNKLSITNPEGSDLQKNTLGKLDSGLYAGVSLNLKAW